MKEHSISLWAILGLFMCGLTAAPVPAGEKDELAIREGSKSFIEAFNRGDAKAIGAMWTNDGDYIDETGQVYSGRKAIAEEFERYFAGNKGRTVRVYIDTIRFVTPEVAIVDGTSEVDPPPDGPPVTGRFSSLRVKQGGKWLVAAVRESAVELPSNYEHLKALDWMLGDWLDEDGDVSIRTSVRWGKNKNFLIREFKVKASDRPVLSGTQQIGWDPERRQIKSWVFDSDGGVSKGYWIQDGDRWIVRVTAMLRDGAEASATNIFTMVDTDTFTWQSRNRVVDGKAQPDIQEVRVVRLPPKAM